MVHQEQLQYIVAFKHGDWLNCQTLCFGPFDDFDDAYNFLCQLPAPRFGDVSGGSVKTIQSVIKPNLSQAKIVIGLADTTGQRGELSKY